MNYEQARMEATSVLAQIGEGYLALEDLKSRLALLKGIMAASKDAEARKAEPQSSETKDTE